MEWREQAEWSGVEIVCKCQPVGCRVGPMSGVEKAGAQWRADWRSVEAGGSEDWRIEGWKDGFVVADASS